jgi:predicted RNA-binding protein associated with RNAse of E/G family
MSEHPTVRIHYKRPPNRIQIFEQTLVHDGSDVKVTLARSMPYEPPMRIEGQVVLELGSDVVWFTFPDQWHDVGRFHRADGTFTGLYANILTPPVLEGTDWATTDLFLDVWVSPSGEVMLLDEDELDEALGREWVDAETAARAREEARRLVDGALLKSWPPPEVHAWSLNRCLEELGLERP